MTRMANLRGESIGDYIVRFWIEQFQFDGYDFDTIVDIINYGISNVKKYGNNPLAYSELIISYKENKETKAIDWAEFKRILRIYEQKAMADIVRLCGRHITLDEYEKHKEYLERQFEIKYGIRNTPEEVS